MPSCYIVNKQGIYKCRYCGIQMGEKHLSGCFCFRRDDYVGRINKEIENVVFAQQLTDGVRLLNIEGDRI